MARPNRRCRGGCNRRLRLTEWMVRKTCERCSKRLTVPVANVEKSGGVTTYDLGLFGNGADLMTNRLSLTHGRLTPKVWEGAADADLDSILRNRFPTAEQHSEDVIAANMARFDATRQYPSLAHDPDAASALG